jgi:hypothetical protein
LTIEIFGTISQRTSSIYNIDKGNARTSLLACAIAFSSSSCSLGTLTTQPQPTSLSLSITISREDATINAVSISTPQNLIHLPLEVAKKDLSLLKQARMRKLNFADGELFIYPKFTGKLAKYWKDDLHIGSISIVTNGSFVKPSSSEIS